MCLGGGGGSSKVPTPKPKPLPAPLPPPPPPKPQQVAKKIQAPDAKPEIKIGKAKEASRSGRQRSTGSLGSSSAGGGTSNQGLNI